MTFIFCTLFDKNYIYRGLALHDSLMQIGIVFELYILCLDSETFTLLTQLQLPGVQLVPLAQVEDEAVLRAKSNRSRVEYYWTLASVFTHYLLSRHSEMVSLAYLDSDLYFFSNPEPLYAELGEGSVLIIRHNYSPELRYLEARSGIYNVGLVWFKQDEAGLACLTRWRDDCLQWCYNRLEEGKFGDQMYLDIWPHAYPGVRVLAHPGGGVAPWNVGQYTVFRVGTAVMIAPEYPLIFFHFHSLRILGNGRYIPHSAAYRFNPAVYEYMYQPYFRSLTKVITTVEQKNPGYPYGFDVAERWLSRWKDALKRYLVLVRYKIIAS